MHFASLLRPIASVLIVAAFAAPVRAETYPSRPITLVVPFAAGAATDLIGRFVADKLRERLGQPVIVDNRPGAGSLIGSSFVARAAPDGYTLLMTNVGLTSGPFLSKNFNLDPVRDLSHIAILCESPPLIVTNSQIPAKTLGEFIAYGKANPGKLNVGSYVPIGDLDTAHFSKRSGVDLTMIPYRGAAPALLALVTNEVQVLFAASHRMVQEHVETKQVKVLAVQTPKKSPFDAGIPTTREAGLEGFETSAIWFGIAGPKGLPSDIVAKLNSELNQILQLPDAKKQITDNLLNVIVGGTSAEAERYVAEDLKRFDDAVKLTGYQAR